MNGNGTYFRKIVNTKQYIQKAGLWHTCLLRKDHFGHLIKHVDTLLCHQILLDSFLQVE